MVGWSKIQKLEYLGTEHNFSRKQNLKLCLRFLLESLFSEVGRLLQAYNFRGKWTT